MFFYKIVFHHQVIDVSKLHLHDVFDKVHQYISSWESRGRPIRMIIVSWIAITFYIFYLLYQYIRFDLRLINSYTYIHQVLSGDAKANQLMQVIKQVVRKLDSNPPILLLLLPLGSKANISFSLGWVSENLHHIFLL